MGHSPVQAPWDASQFPEQRVIDLTSQAAKPFEPNVYRAGLFAETLPMRDPRSADDKPRAFAHACSPPPPRAKVSAGQASGVLWANNGPERVQQWMHQKAGYWITSSARASLAAAPAIVS
jgi:hypothetical protein